MSLRSDGHSAGDGFIEVAVQDSKIIRVDNAFQFYGHFSDGLADIAASELLIEMSTVTPFRGEIETPMLVTRDMLTLAP